MENKDNEIPTLDHAVTTRYAQLILILSIMLAVPETALAYVGPGAGLSIIGSVLAFFAAIIIGIFGFLWFPIRRLLRKRKQAAQQQADDSKTESRAESIEPPDDSGDKDVERSGRKA